METFFWIFALVCVATAQGTVTVQNTIETADRVVDLYNAVDSKIPWGKFDELLSDSDKFTEMYSKESGSMVGGIKTHIMNAIDGHFQATQHMAEWCQLVIPLFSTHTQLFKGYNAAKAKIQNTLLRKLFSDGSERMNLAQADLDKISTNFKAVIEEYTPLFKQFNKDFDGQNVFFQTKLKHYLRSVDTIKKTTDNALAAFQEQLGNISKLYLNTFNLVGESIADIDGIKSVIKAQIEEFDQMKSQAEKLNNFDLIAANPKLQDDIIVATQNLITECKGYKEKHKP